MSTWIDTHVHLERYDPAERPNLFTRAAAAGVGQLIAVSTSMDSSRRTLALHEPVLKAVGVHPQQAHTLVVPEFAKLAASPDVVAIGEIGFDGRGPGRAVQGVAFQQQALIARDLDLAVLLHIDGPGAWQAFDFAASFLDGLRVVRHYFTGDDEQLDYHIAHRQFISFGRPLLREGRLQALAKRVPDDLLLIETDAYPLPCRTTTPADLLDVARELAALRALSLDALQALLYDNTKRALGPHAGQLSAERIAGHAP